MSARKNTRPVKPTRHQLESAVRRCIIAARDHEHMVGLSRYTGTPEQAWQENSAAQRDLIALLDRFFGKDGAA